MNGFVPQARLFDADILVVSFVRLHCGQTYPIVLESARTPPLRVGTANPEG